MLLKTNIPKPTQSFAGVRVEFGDTLDRLNSLNDQAIKIQEPIILGNRCGHVPNDPRFYLRPENSKTRPSILENAIERLKDVYRRPKKFFRKLATFHPHNRQKRSERREAIASISQVLLNYLELSTLRVGFYAETKFINLDLEYIAKKAGLNFIRGKRAIADLVKAGYIKVSRQFDKKEDGTFKGKPSIREISVQFFIDLGIDVQKLFYTREWKRKKQEKLFQKKAQKKMRDMMQAVASFGKRITPKNTRRTISQKAEKDLIAKALELHKINPERSPSEYLQELRRFKE
jgi:hypothetical protein